MGTIDAAPGPPRRAAVCAASGPGGTARLAAVVGAALAGLLAVLLPAAPARAHAVPVATTPAQGSVIGSSPTEVTVTFSEPVTLIAGRIQVLAPDGKRINHGTPTVRGATVHIPVRRADRPLGTYLVSFRVVSADSHPVGGGFTFSVGAPSAAPPQAPSDAVHRSVAVGVATATFLGYAGLLLVVGPTLLLALLWPRRVPRRSGIRLVRTGLGLVAAGTLAGLWLQAPYRSGAPAWDVSGPELGQILVDRYGVAMVARLAALAALLALLTPALHGRAGRGRTALLTGIGAAALVTWPLSGHAVASPVPAASVVADVVHLAAMSVWLGGLATLLAVLLRRTHPRVLAVILPVWSRWATLAVVWLVAAGAVQAVIEIGGPAALTGTTYGRLVLAKVAVLALVLAAAAGARRLVHRTAEPGTGATADRAAGARTSVGMVRRLVAVEAAGTALILGLTAVLVQVTPARSAAAEQAVVDNGRGVSGTLTSDLFTLQFNIYPVQRGENNTVHAFVYTPQGKPLAAQEWQVTTVLPALGTEPVTRPLLGVLPHHGLGAVTFPIPGEWEVRFTVRTSEIDQATVRTTVTVR